LERRLFLLGTYCGTIFDAVPLTPAPLPPGY
jgi:hypothetical protein